MKAAIYTERSSRKLLELVDIDPPVPKKGEVLIKVRAASVNPLDWRLKSHRPGVDLAGEVTSVGNQVTRFKPGDAVFGLGKGAFAEYAVARESGLTAKQDNLTFEQAACVPIAGLTALQGLRDKGKLAPGQKVLINGAAGGVGTFAVQIAKISGAEVTGVCSTRNVELVRSLAGLRSGDKAIRSCPRQCRKPHAVRSPSRSDPAGPVRVGRCAEGVGPAALANARDDRPVIHPAPEACVLCSASKARRSRVALRMDANRQNASRN
jgi:D-arabinose 1-dehydrogenase-like Zn-dependent alcohol dehydrogenase